MVKVKRLSIALFALFVVTALSFPVLPAQAASLTSMSDTLSALEATDVANHTILFVTPTGVESSTDTITIDLSDFTTGSVDFTDVDLAVDDDNQCDGAWSIEKTLAAAAGAGEWGAVFSTGVLTLTPPTDAGAGEITADRCVQVQIGLNAASGDQQLTSPAAGEVTVDIAGVFGDTGTYAVRIISEDDVAVIATVDPTISFSISDTSIGFGTLSSSAARYATTGGGAGSESVAHTLIAGTNATNGYSITIDGATLVSGSDSIDAIGGTPAASNPGTEQFGIMITESGGSGAAVSPYDGVTYALDTGTFPDEVAAASGASADTTFSVYYLANIASATEAGSYSATMTYVATATF